MFNEILCCACGMNWCVVAVEESAKHCRVLLHVEDHRPICSAGQCEFVMPSSLLISVTISIYPSPFSDKMIKNWLWQ